MILFEYSEIFGIFCIGLVGGVFLSFIPFAFGMVFSVFKKICS